MRNRIVKVTEVVVRSAFYIISNYVFVSMGLSFHTQWISILFLLSMVWSTIDYGKSINEIIEKKVIAEILCICCIALSIAMAYFVGGCKIFCVYGNETFQIRIRYVVVFVGFCSRIFCRIYLSGYSISCPLSFIHAF